MEHAITLGLIVTNSAHTFKDNIRNGNTLERGICFFFFMCKICSTSEVIEKNRERMTLIAENERIFVQTNAIRIWTRLIAHFFQCVLFVCFSLNELLFKFCDVMETIPNTESQLLYFHCNNSLTWRIMMSWCIHIFMAIYLGIFSLLLYGLTARENVIMCVCCSWIVKL